ncbi:MAG: hypothetical protein OXH36_02705 [Bdellovibrionales bacterium]|nr:hypothetical protein [Bdellovibrionales bacterium]
MHWLHKRNLIRSCISAMSHHWINCENITTFGGYLSTEYIVTSIKTKEERIASS